MEKNKENNEKLVRKNSKVNQEREVKHGFSCIIKDFDLNHLRPDGQDEMVSYVVFDLRDSS